MTGVGRQRLRVLLSVVARSGGEWSTRDIDFEVNRRVPPGEATVLEELQALERDGLVERVEKPPDPSFVGWRITAGGKDAISGRSDS